jgi:hypothetical protein
MDRPTCATCRWWSVVEYLYGMHECMVNSRHGLGEPDGIYVAPDTDCGGGTIVTGPSFGCIHHQPVEMKA